MDKASHAFETFFRLRPFMDKIDSYINQAIDDKRISAKNVPTLVLLIVKLIATQPAHKLTEEDMGKLMLDLFYDYIIAKIEYDQVDFRYTYTTCVELAVLKLNLALKPRFCCF